MTKPICEKCGNDGTQGAIFLTIDARWMPDTGEWALLEPMPDLKPSGWDCLACDHVTPRDGQSALFPYGLAVSAGHAPRPLEPEPEPQFRNFYKCPECGEVWEDVWSCACDDTCPHCGCRNISPEDSEEIEPTPL